MPNTARENGTSAMNREERVRRALQATILHWPTDLNETSIRAYEDDFDGRVWITVRWREGAMKVGVRIPFTPKELLLPPTLPRFRLKVEDVARTYAKPSPNLDRHGLRETSYTDPDR